MTKRQSEQRLAYLASAILRDEMFMQDCAGNPHSSYYGENSHAVRQADQSAIDKMRAEYRDLRDAGFSPKQHKRIIL